MTIFIDEDSAASQAKLVRGAKQSLKAWTDTSHWTNRVGLTLTWHKVVYGQAVTYAERKWLLPVFLKDVNQALFKKAYKYYGKQANFVAVWECDDQLGWHVHAIMEKPPGRDDREFQRLLRSLWTKHLITDVIDIARNDDSSVKNVDDGWTRYMHKLRTKDADWTEALDFDCYTNK